MMIHSLAIVALQKIMERIIKLPVSIPGVIDR